MSWIKRRQEDLRKSLLEQKIDAFVVSKPENIFYLSGFSGSTAELLITMDRAVLVTDFRYGERAEEEASEVEVESSPDILGGLRELIKNLGVKAIAVETHFLTHEAYEKLKIKLAPVEVRSASKAVEKLREIKDEQELILMTKSAEISSAAFSHILSFIKPGLTEKKISVELKSFLYRQGADEMAFEVIVAGGPRSAMPHAKPSERRIARGDLVTVDLGVVHGMYFSDMTRTFVVGKASKKRRELYDLVKESQRQTLESISVGKSGEQIDKVCRDLFDSARSGAYFLHNLGHGIGLEVHESPVLGAGEKNILRQGMVFTVEPALYITGFGGVRIEDMVVLRHDGPELLTKYSRELIEL